MKRCQAIRKQRGAVLIVGLIMLTLITIIVTSAYNLSTTNLKAVGNMQFRNEAIAAANKAIEQILSSPFHDSPSGESIDVDIDNDGRRDYEVVFQEPTCISAVEIAPAEIPPSSLSLGTGFVVATSNFYQTVWDLDGQVTDEATGASVRVRQGTRVLLTKPQYDAVCT